MAFNLQELIKNISNMMVSEFKNKYHQNMDRQEYLELFLGTFLGQHYFHGIASDFDEYCHEIIDSISLNGEEIDFFHRMVDLEYDENYIDNCITIYHSIDGLDRCQLGDGIMKCLEASKKD